LGQEPLATNLEVSAGPGSSSQPAQSPPGAPRHTTLEFGAECSQCAAEPAEGYPEIMEPIEVISPQPLAGLDPSVEVVPRHGSGHLDCRAVQHWGAWLHVTLPPIRQCCRWAAQTPSTDWPPRAAQALMPSLVVNIPITRALWLPCAGCQAHVVALTGHGTIQVFCELAHESGMRLLSGGCGH